MGDGVIATRRDPAARRGVRDVREHRFVHRRIADDPALADLVAARFELRLHQRDDVGDGREHGRQRGKNVAQGDERHVDGGQVDRMRNIVAESARVR